MDLDDVQKRILVGCLSCESIATVNVMSYKGRMVLLVNIGLQNSEIDANGYLDFQNHWIQDLISNGYLYKKNSSPVRSGEAFWLTEKGLETARNFKSQFSHSENFASAGAEAENKNKQ